MSADEKALSRASETYGASIRERRVRAAARLDEIAARDARIGEIASEMRLAGLAAVRAAMEDVPEDVEKRVRSIAEHNLALQTERSDRLRALGYPEDYLYAGPFCGVCGDTGYHDGAMCGCFQPFYIRALGDQIDEAVGKGFPTFETFNMSIFTASVAIPDAGSRAERMAVVQKCRDYAGMLGATSENLLLRGESGRGKTTLAVCIAREAVRRGVGVLYISAPALFSLREEERFRRDEEAGAELARYRVCDALVLDDVGLEATAPMNAPTLLSLLTAREAAGLPTILCTALYGKDLSGRYSTAVASRLENDFKAIELRGLDLRRMLKTTV
ncbi:MAG: ATP-binding protein [Clostridiaceae bacterium]|nr:ATP-binding protein [Clostridiaceae bacterium]